jgi:hypothetical protein
MARFEKMMSYSSPWWWRQQVPLKRQRPSTGLPGVTSQKTVVFILGVVRTWNLTLYPFSLSPWLYRSWTVLAASLLEVWEPFFDSWSDFLDRGSSQGLPTQYALHRRGQTSMLWAGFPCPAWLIAIKSITLRNTERCIALFVNHACIHIDSCGIY